MSLINKVKNRIINKYYRMTDPLCAYDLKATPIIPRGICKKGLLPPGRIRLLEVGPRWGQDARDWDRRISPSEMVFIDLPETKESISLWIKELKSPHKVIYANILHLGPQEKKEIGTFDLVYCSGVIYHLAEQLRLCKILFDFLREGGLLVLESYVVKGEEKAVKVFWPDTHQKALCHHIPTRGCLKAWLEMVGFSDVRVHNDIYPRRYKNRTVLTSVRKPGARTPSYLGFDTREENDAKPDLKKAVGLTEYIPINYIP